MLLSDWLTRTDLRPLEYLVKPWLPVGGIILLHGPRGISKTNVATAIGLSVAEGAPLLDFEVPMDRPVVYVDGEMQRVLVRDRLRKFINHTARPRAMRNFHYHSYADTPDQLGFGDLADARSGGQEAVEEMIRRARRLEDEPVLLILDNKSCLLSVDDENAASADLMAFLRWVLKLRAQNVSTILVHHDGKPDRFGNSTQHGTSALERYPDTIIGLASNGKPSNGTIPVRWSYEKERSFTPDERDVFLNIRYDDEEKLAWLEVTENQRDIAAEAVVSTWKLNSEMSVREIASITGIPKSTVARILHKLPEYVAVQEERRDRQALKS